RACGSDEHAPRTWAWDARAQQDGLEPGRMPGIAPPPPGESVRLLPELVLALLLLDHALGSTVRRPGAEVLAMTIGFTDHPDVRPVEIDVSIAAQSRQPEVLLQHRHGEPELLDHQPAERLQRGLGQGGHAIEDRTHPTGAMKRSQTLVLGHELLRCDQRSPALRPRHH